MTEWKQKEIRFFRNVLAYTTLITSTANTKSFEGLDVTPLLKDIYPNFSEYSKCLDTWNLCDALTQMYTHLTAREKLPSSREAGTFRDVRIDSAKQETEGLNSWTFVVKNCKLRKLDLLVFTCKATCPTEKFYGILRSTRKLLPSSSSTSSATSVSPTADGISSSHRRGEVPGSTSGLALECLVIIDSPGVHHTANQKASLEQDVWTFSKVFSIAPFWRTCFAIFELQKSRYLTSLTNPLVDSLINYGKEGPALAQAEALAFFQRDGFQYFSPSQQLAIMESHWRQDITLIHAPPGTGKVELTVGFCLYAYYIYEMRQRRSILSRDRERPPRILICSSNWLALDAVMTRIVAVAEMLTTKGQPQPPTSGTPTTSGSHFTIREKAATANWLLSMVRVGELGSSSSSCSVPQDSNKSTTTTTPCPPLQRFTLDTLLATTTTTTTTSTSTTTTATVTTSKLPQPPLRERTKQLLDEQHLLLLNLPNPYLSSTLGTMSTYIDSLGVTELFDLLLVVDATSISELTLLIPFSRLKPTLGKCVLVGDYLRAIHPPSTTTAATTTSVVLPSSPSQSLYERIQRIRPFSLIVLDLQFRISPELLDYPNRQFYENSIKSSPLAPLPPTPPSSWYLPYPQRRLFQQWWEVTTSEILTPSFHSSSTLASSQEPPWDTLKTTMLRLTQAKSEVTPGGIPTSTTVWVPSLPSLVVPLLGPFCYYYLPAPSQLLLPVLQNLLRALPSSLGTIPILTWTFSALTSQLASELTGGKGDKVEVEVDSLDRYLALGKRSPILLLVLLGRGRAEGGEGERPKWVAGVTRASHSLLVVSDEDTSALALEAKAHHCFVALPEGEGDLLRQPRYDYISTWVDTQRQVTQAVWQLTQQGQHIPFLPTACLPETTRHPGGSGEGGYTALVNSPLERPWQLIAMEQASRLPPFPPVDATSLLPWVREVIEKLRGLRQEVRSGLRPPMVAPFPLGTGLGSQVFSGPNGGSSTTTTVFGSGGGSGSRPTWAPPWITLTRRQPLWKEREKDEEDKVPVVVGATAAASDGSGGGSSSGLLHELTFPEPPFAPTLIMEFSPHDYDPTSAVYSSAEEDSLPADVTYTPLPAPPPQSPVPLGPPEPPGRVDEVVEKAAPPQGKSSAAVAIGEDSSSSSGSGDEDSSSFISSTTTSSTETSSSGDDEEDVAEDEGKEGEENVEKAQQQLQPLVLPLNTPKRKRASKPNSPGKAQAKRQKQQKTPQKLTKTTTPPQKHKKVKKRKRRPKEEEEDKKGSSSSVGKKKKKVSPPSLTSTHSNHNNNRKKAKSKGIEKIKEGDEEGNKKSKKGKLAATVGNSPSSSTTTTASVGRREPKYPRCDVCGHCHSVVHGCEEVLAGGGEADGDGNAKGTEPEIEDRRDTEVETDEAEGILELPSPPHLPYFIEQA